MKNDELWACLFDYFRDGSFRYKIVSIRTQAVQLQKNFAHFKFSLRVKKKNIFGGYCSFLAKCVKLFTARLNKLVLKRLYVDNNNNNNNNNKTLLWTDNLTEALPAASKAIRGGTVRTKKEIKSKAK